jgi:hypothetical protein
MADAVGRENTNVQSAVCASAPIQTTSAGFYANLRSINKVNISKKFNKNARAGPVLRWDQEDIEALL